MDFLSLLIVFLVSLHNLLFYHEAEKIIFFLSSVRARTTESVDLFFVLLLFDFANMFVGGIE